MIQCSATPAAHGTPPGSVKTPSVERPQRFTQSTTTSRGPIGPTLERRADHDERLTIAGDQRGHWSGHVSHARSAAIDATFCRDLRDAVHVLEADDSPRVVVTRTTGRHFRD